MQFEFQQDLVDQLTTQCVRKKPSLVILTCEGFGEWASPFLLIIKFYPFIYRR